MPRTFLVTLGALVAACGTDPAGTAGSAEPLGSETVAVAVMTRNLYIGADILRVVNAQGAAQVAEAVAETFAIVGQTSFPARARLIAAEIDWTRPDVVALEEVAIWRVGPGAACAGDPTPRAARVVYDLLGILQHVLEERGLRYEVASQLTTLDAELCSADGTDVRYTDRDVLLVRRGLATRAPASGTYQAVAELPVVVDPEASPPVVHTIPDPRGWNAVEVQKRGKWFRVVETHLEDLLPIDPPWLVQMAQAGELVATVAAMAEASPMPTILAGDFNAPADPSFAQPTYAFLAGGQPFPLDVPGLAGIASPFEDPWLALRPGVPGFTWGFDELLLGGTLTERLDLVLGWGARPVATRLVGIADRTRAGLHASDHAGVVTVFALP
jgi:endonuclease/exonuclease/phosphatase family metal-dependent hydrolase